jgi:hypothetical protein
LWSCKNHDRTQLFKNNCCSVIQAHLYSPTAIEECEIHPLTEYNRRLLDTSVYWRHTSSQKCCCASNPAPPTGLLSLMFKLHHDMYRSYLPSRGGVSSIVVVPSASIRLRKACLSASIPFVLGSMEFSFETPRAVRRL